MPQEDPFSCPFKFDKWHIICLCVFTNQSPKPLVQKFKHNKHKLRFLTCVFNGMGNLDFLSSSYLGILDIWQGDLGSKYPNPKTHQQFKKNPLNPKP